MTVSRDDADELAEMVPPSSELLCVCEATGEPVIIADSVLSVVTVDVAVIVSVERRVRVTLGVSVAIVETDCVNESRAEVDGLEEADDLIELVDDADAASVVIGVPLGKRPVAVAIRELRAEAVASTLPVEVIDNVAVERLVVVAETEITAVDVEVIVDVPKSLEVIETELDTEYVSREDCDGEDDGDADLVAPFESVNGRVPRAL